MPILDNKVALITGSGGGMGRAHALLMAERGADIVVADLDGEKAAETAEMVRERGRRAHVETVDMGDTKAVKEMVKSAAAALGPIGILVNNAGFGQRAEFTDISESDFDRMFAVHVRGSFFATQTVIPAMKEARYGKIINIASIWGMTGAPVASHYCGAKAALIGFTKCWAKEFAPWNVHVNAVAPGGVRSGGPLRFDTEETRRAKEEKVPLKRYCEPIEMAYAVAFLASSEADFITGQVLSPNGGEVIVGI
ncbi:3-oxoacyl-[acyl-carrier protein] reductase [Rhodoligotrophos appendicifer]|uniref:SDR family NAD(P)-dependent oxidoreductase n=1 Tax=Rhodoligotrophos appendicifer TaxID=987056 RepID=UPI00117D96BF|nr:SDR family oxidoreductase [Rhodoligotrophos appendicifer]